MCLSVRVCVRLPVYPRVTKREPRTGIEENVIARSDLDFVNFSA